MFNLILTTKNSKTMKKLLLSLMVIVFTFSQLVAQESTFAKGDKVLNLGIGFGSSYYTGYYTSLTPSLSASFEVGVKDGILEKGSIGVGGYMGFASAKYADYWKTSNFLIGVRGSFHYPLVNKLDTYTGLILGYNIYNTKYYDTYYGNESASSSGVQLAWFAGARYYFTDTFSAMAEIGYGISYLTLGVGFKF
jgi:hypothetical protein